MPKNKTGGSGHKKRKNNDSIVTNKKADDLKRNLDPEAHEYYGMVTRVFGGKRFEVQCQSHEDTSRLKVLNAKLAGSCRGKLGVGTYVLVQLYPFNLDQGGIVQVYDTNDVSTLKFAKLWDFPEKKLPNTFMSSEKSFRVEDADSTDSSDDEDVFAPEVEKPVFAQLNDINADSI